jgi:hypothetical protein
MTTMVVIRYSDAGRIIQLQDDYIRTVRELLSCPLRLVCGVDVPCSRVPFMAVRFHFCNDNNERIDCVIYNCCFFFLRLCPHGQS